MSAEIYQTISTVGLFLAMCFALTGMILFFYYDIPTVIDFLTGKTNIKEIDKLRKQSEESMKKIQYARSINYLDALNARDAESNDVESVKPAKKKSRTMPMHSKTKLMMGSTKEYGTPQKYIVEEPIHVEEESLIGFRMIKSVTLCESKEVIE